MPFDATPRPLVADPKPIEKPIEKPPAPPVNDPVLKALIGALVIIERNWAKGPQAGHCAMQAIAVASGAYRNDYHTNIFARGSDDKRAIENAITGWNDRGNRDLVIAGFKAAIARRQAAPKVPGPMDRLRHWWKPAAAVQYRKEGCALELFNAAVVHGRTR